MLNNIKSKYIFGIIIKNYVAKRKYYLLFQHNKNFQKKLDLNLEDYKDLHKKIFLTIELELIPCKQLKPDIKHYFIRTRENKSYYHIYFNNDSIETDRNYLTNFDKVAKIKIKIDMDLKSIKGLFYDCSIIKKIKFTKFNRDDFTDMSEIFYGCSSLDKLDIKLFKTSNVTKMNWMFCLCESLTELDIINFDTSNVIEMMNLFSGCLRLRKINFNFNTENVINMRNMFFKCQSLKQIDVSNFNLSKVQNMNEMFFGCSSLNDLNIDNFKFIKTEVSFTRIFGECNKTLKEKLKKKYFLREDDGYFDKSPLKFNY